MRGKAIFFLIILFAISFVSANPYSFNLYDSPSTSGGNVTNINITLTGNLTNFTDLFDTPSSYSGSAGDCVVVNDSETGLEFISCPGGGSTDLTNVAFTNRSEDWGDNNVSSNWFFGLFDWIISPFSAGYFSFNGSTLDFNETFLNNTISSLASSGGNASWNESLANDLFVNIDGDVMTGNLIINANLTINGSIIQGNYTIHPMSTNGSTIDDVFCLEMPSPDGDRHCKLVIQPGGSGQASIIRRSFAAVNDDICVGANATNMQCYADVGGFEWNIDFNTSVSGADIGIADDLEVIGEIWLRNTRGQSRFFTRILDLGDEQHENILFNDADLAIVNGKLNINDTLNETLVININRTETILEVKSDSITLNTGTDISPAINHITYQNENSPTLTIDTSEPSIPHSEVAIIYVGVDTDNIYLFENTISHNERFIDQVYDTFADLGGIYIDGLSQEVTSTKINISTGTVRLRMNKKAYTNNVDSTNDFFYINSTGNFVECVDNTCLTKYLDDSDISNNKYYSLV